MVSSSQAKYGLILGSHFHYANFELLELPNPKNQVTQTTQPRIRAPFLFVTTVWISSFMIIL
jgi:hypothetical protein